MKIYNAKQDTFGETDTSKVFLPSPNTIGVSLQRQQSLNILRYNNCLIQEKLY